MALKRSFSFGFLPALLPIAVLLVSGCVSGPSGGTGPGLVIHNWEPDFSSVESGDNIQLRIRVQNQGGEQAQDVVARLYGIDISDWTGGSGFGTSAVDIDFGNLDPPNPAYGTDGEEHEDFYSLEAPELPEGITYTYTPKVRVYYTYRTVGLKPITLVNENELRRLMDSGDFLPVGSTTVSGGPVSLSVTTGNTIRVNEDGVRFFPITLHLENTGGGVVSPRESSIGGGYFSIGDNEDYLVRVIIQLPDGLRLGNNCDNYAGTVSGTAFTGYSWGDGDVKPLWKGQSADITCDIEVINPPVVSEQKSMMIGLEYDYYVDSSTSVTVKGTGSSAGGLF